MNVREFLRSVRDSLRGGWSPAGTVAIAIMVAIGLMALGVLHVYLKSLRSEERRVGKECRSRWSPYH
jgi:cell division protein FtsX